MIKNMLGEFKKFVMRGNVIDMAVGIIIGGAFTKIVNSMVADVMMPPLGLLMGKVDFPIGLSSLKTVPKCLLRTLLCLRPKPPVRPRLMWATF